MFYFPFHFILVYSQHVLAKPKRYGLIHRDYCVRAELNLKNDPTYAAFMSIASKQYDPPKEAVAATSLNDNKIADISAIFLAPVLAFCCRAS